MPPAAVALALLLHAVVAAVLWFWAPPRKSEASPEPVMILFDSSPSNVGLQEPERTGPPAEAIAAAPLPDDGREPAALQSPTTDAAVQPVPNDPAPAATSPASRHPGPVSPDRPPSTDPTQQALASPAAPPGPQPASPPSAAAAPPPAAFPLYEFSIPPVPGAPPPPTSRDFARPRVVTPIRPAQRPPPRPAPPSQYRPPADTTAAMPAPLPGPTMADQIAGAGRQRNDYLTRLFRHLEPHRANALGGRAASLHGRVVTRVTIARNGSVLDVSLDSSSGRPALDAAELTAIRNGAPFPPVPAGMPGDPVILILRMTY